MHARGQIPRAQAGRRPRWQRVRRASEGRARVDFPAMSKSRRSEAVRFSGKSIRVIDMKT
jgi:hypothetical protein